MLENVELGIEPAERVCIVGRNGSGKSTLLPLLAGEIETDDGELRRQRGIQPRHAERLRIQLSALDTATSLEDMDIPRFRLHPLKGSQGARWSVWVSGNWRLTFEFRDGNAYVLDYEDYR